MISQEMKAINDLVQEVNALKRRVQQLEDAKDGYGPLKVDAITYAKIPSSPWSEDYKGPNGFFNDPNRPFP